MHTFIRGKVFRIMPMRYDEEFKARAVRLVAEHGGEYDFDLVEREGHAETTPHTAAERQPFVGVDLLAHEPLGLERIRIRIQLGAAVQNRSARRTQHACGDRMIPQFERRLENAPRRGRRDSTARA